MTHHNSNWIDDLHLVYDVLRQTVVFNMNSNRRRIVKMSFFSDSDLKIARQKIANENAKKEQEAYERKLYGKMCALKMMETFLLYKEAATEYPNICRSLGVEPISVTEEGFLGHTYYLYSLSCKSITDNPSMYICNSLFNVGVTKNGGLVDFMATNHIYRNTKRGYEYYYTVQRFPEFDLRRRFEYFFSQYSSGSGTISLNESTMGLMGQLLLFSFPGSCWEMNHDMYSEIHVECNTLNPKGKEEVRKSIKRYFLGMATNSISPNYYNY